MPNLKIEITQRVLELQDVADVNLTQALQQWYHNIRNQGGMRLTAQGHAAFRASRINSWAWQPKNPKILNQAKVMIALDRRMRWPYYLDRKQGTVIFFSSREATMVTLYDDLENFLENYQ